MPVLLLLAWVALQARPADAPPGPALIRVHVTTDVDGDAAERAARRQSAKDVADALAKKKTLAVVDRDAAADVVVTIVARTTTIPKVTFGLMPRPGPAGSPGPSRSAHLRVTLESGDDDPVTFTNKAAYAESAGGWSVAAADVVKQIDRWIGDHRTQILARRARGGGGA